MRPVHSKIRNITRRSRKGCSAHYIRAVVLEELVLQNIQRVLAYVQDDEAEFVKLVQRNESYASSINLDKAKKASQKNEVRIAELDEAIKNFKFKNQGKWEWTTNPNSNVPMLSYSPKVLNQSEYDALLDLNAYKETLDK